MLVITKYHFQITIILLNRKPNRKFEKIQNENLNKINKAKGIVKEYRKQGYSEDKIRDIFKKNQWDDKDIKLILK